MPSQTPASPGCRGKIVLPALCPTNPGPSHHSSRCICVTGLAWVLTMGRPSAWMRSSFVLTELVGRGLGLRRRKPGQGQAGWGDLGWEGAARKLAQRCGSRVYGKRDMIWPGWCPCARDWGWAGRALWTLPGTFVFLPEGFVHFRVDKQGACQVRDQGSR